MNTSSLCPRACSAEVIATDMLADPTKVPKPALKVIEDLAGQQLALERPSSGPQLEMETGRFTSPLAEWLPEKSKLCEFHVLKPPAGTFFLWQSVLLLHVSHACPACTKFGQRLRQCCTFQGSVVSDL
jgi:hypothetical protein